MIYGARKVSNTGWRFSVCSPVTSDVPLLTNHLSLQRLSLHGNKEHLISELERLPFFAPSSLVDIHVHIDFLESTEIQWKAVDLALCDSKFPHLKSIEFSESPPYPLRNPHAFFEQALPNSYERGIIWLLPRQFGMHLVAIILHHSDLYRRTYTHRSGGCPAIP